MSASVLRRTASGARVVRARSFVVRVDARALTVGVCLAACLTAVSVVAMTGGEYQISAGRVVETLLGHGSAIETFIVETLRLPRLVTGILVGAALGIGGAVFQSLSRNPLGSPDIVGFDTGAATGALIVILAMHGSSAQLSAGAILGGVGTALAVYLIAMKRGVHGYRLILIGIGIAAMLESFNAYLLTRAQVADAQSAAVWLTGSLNGRGWEQARPVAIALLVLLPASCWLGRRLRMLELGDDTAGMLGVHPERTRLAGVVVGVGLAAVATSAAGPIGFVALAAPQLTRRLTRAPGPNVLPTAIMGALLLSASDVVAQRAFQPTQLPVGVVTAAVGGGYLAWLLGREWRRGRG
jgi:iron complex transport system permease protein